jgi:hypothetical protein
MRNITNFVTKSQRSSSKTSSTVEMPCTIADKCSEIKWVVTLSLYRDAKGELWNVRAPRPVLQHDIPDPYRYGDYGEEHKIFDTKEEAEDYCGGFTVKERVSTHPIKERQLGGQDYCSFTCF